MIHCSRLYSALAQILYRCRTETLCARAICSALRSRSVRLRRTCARIRLSMMSAGTTPPSRPEPPADNNNPRTSSILAQPDSSAAGSSLSESASRVSRQLPAPAQALSVPVSGCGPAGCPTSAHGKCWRRRTSTSNCACTPRSAFGIQRRNPGVTELVVLEDRGHSMPADHGWGELADTALDFLAKNGLPAQVEA